MTLKERSIWGTLVALTAYWIFYGFGVIEAAIRGEQDLSYFTGLLIVGAILSGAIQAVVHRFAEMRGSEGVDERDENIARAAGLTSYRILVGFVYAVTIVLLAIALGLRSTTLEYLITLTQAMAALMIASALVMGLVFAEIARCIVTLRLYRMQS